ncbi:MAG: nitrile hydratase subunit beta [Microbacteriaceae bacterium]
MNGVHDLGGMHGFGPVEPEKNEPPFHDDWEAVMVAIQNAVCREDSGVMNIDEFRHGIERMDPVYYLGSSYFEHWMDGITRVLLEKDVISLEEIDSRTAFFQEHEDAPATAVLTNLPTPRARSTGERRGVIRPATSAPRFAPGDAVVTRIDAPTGHTRLPRYARGKRGVVERLHGVHVFPDANAHGQGEQPQPLYSVRFAARDLWGNAAEPNQTVNIDMWQSNLESDAQ